MKETKKLYDSISNIDHRFIEEAQTEEIRKAPTWRDRAALAACLCAAAVCAITVICAIAVVRPQKTAPVPKPGPTIGDDPKSGKYSSATLFHRACRMGLRAAIRFMPCSTTLMQLL